MPPPSVREVNCVNEIQIIDNETTEQCEHPRRREKVFALHFFTLHFSLFTFHSYSAADVGSVVEEALKSFIVNVFIISSKSTVSS